MKWKQFVNDYFLFSRKERIAVIVLIIAIIILFFFPIIIKTSQPNIVPADTSWMASAKRLESPIPSNNINSERNKSVRDPKYEDKPVAIAVFEFDPNTLSPEGWKKLGIKQRTIATIQNYLNKGGHFRHAEDLKKIYGLSPTDYQRLEQYVKIEAAESNESNKLTEYSRRALPQKGPTHSVVDINNCDTSAFISLPGIGSKLASRIINFRERLGGFHSVEQIGEVYGVPDSTFQKLKPWLELGNRAVRKININTATVEELKSHPYFGYKIANPIIAYRSSHGPFTNLEDIKKVMAVTEELYNKIVPYLTIE